MSTREHIIDTAFRVWSASGFAATGLAAVADSLDITKTALYRHFRDKAALLDAMLDRLFDEMTAHAVPGSDQRPPASLIAATDRFIDSQFRFLAERPWYLLFVLHAHHRTWVTDDARMQQLMRRTAEWFAAAPDADSLAFPAGELPRLLARTGMFLLLSALDAANAGGTSDDCGELVIASPAVDHLIGRLRHIARSGFAGNRPVPAPIDFALIERQALVETGDLLAREPLVEAVARVVARRGLSGASVQDIAREAGMSKSSLYHHFSSRADMLDRLLTSETRHLQLLIAQRTRDMPRAEHRLYASLVIITAYLLRDTTLLTVLQWLTRSGMTAELAAVGRRLPRTVPPYLSELAATGGLEPGELGLTGLTDCIRFLVISDIFERYVGSDGVAAQEDVSALAVPCRSLYRFITSGCGAVTGPRAEVPEETLQP